MSTPEKVLIVEDEENERSGLAELVSAWGYRTETAKDGLEGLEKVATWSPGIVITDFKMPRMNGMELLERIAEQPQRIAVILLTAQGSIDVAVDDALAAQPVEGRGIGGDHDADIDAELGERRRQGAADIGEPA